jgi:hypothetical protein
VQHINYKVMARETKCYSPDNISCPMHTYYKLCLIIERLGDCHLWQLMRQTPRVTSHRHQYALYGGVKMLSFFVSKGIHPSQTKWLYTCRRNTSVLQWENQ